MYHLYGCVNLWVTGGIWLSLNTILFFYQAIFKLATEELSSLALRDLYWTCIPDQPHSFYQVRNRRQFLVDVLHHFKPGKRLRELGA